VPPSELMVEPSDPITIESGGAASLNVMANFVIDSISWSPDPTLNCTECPNPLASPLNNTTYTATVFDIQGCFLTTTVRVIIDKVQNVYIPNVFSPNEDGINDEFFVFGNVEVAAIKEMSIYDRWGNQVFYMEDAPPNNPRWRGMSP